MPLLRFRTIAFALLCSWFLSTSFRAASEQVETKAIELADIMAWSSITGTALSEDGEWFGYRVGPTEGDSEVIVLQTKGNQQYKFNVGEIPVPEPALPGAPPPDGPPPGAGPAVLFSSDGKFAAFTIFPSRAEAAQLRRQRRPLQNKTGIVNLANGEKVEIAKVRRFVFSGENPAWIALHKYGAEAGPAAASAPPVNGATPAQNDRPKGSDLLLRELATGEEFNIGNVADFAFNKKGTYLAWTIDAQDKAGNAIQLREMGTGAVRSLDSDDMAVYSRVAWTEAGDGLTALKGIDRKGYEDKLYSVLAFKEFRSAGPQKTLFTPDDFPDFPAGMTVSPDRTATWLKDLSGVLFGIHNAKKKEDTAGDTAERPAAAAGAAAPGENSTPAQDKVDVVIWNYQDKRLQSQQQIQENQDKNFSYLAIYRPAEKKFIRIADDGMRDVATSPEHNFGLGRNIAPYEMMSNIDGRRFADVYAVDLQTGERKLAMKKSRWALPLSPTGDHAAYYEDGQYFSYDMKTGQTVNITKGIPASFIDTESDVNVVKPPTPFYGWSKDGKYLLLSDNWDIWQVPVTGGTATNLTVNGRKEQLRYRRPYILDPEQRGFDLSQPLYLEVYGEWTKKDGLGIIEPGKPGVNRVMWDEAAYGGLAKAKKADVYVYTRQTYKDAPDVYLTDASLMNGKAITDLSAGQEKFRWTSGTILVNYVSDKGDKLQGALHLPANYEKGTQYPTIVFFYEKMSNTAFQYSRPTANGFNTSVYTSNGYAVFNPDITYKLNDPGMSAVWCLVPAVKAAIATGVVDPKHVGIHGHSWGGYQTAFTITQTDIFAAAIAGAPLTDMISMYGILYKNSGGTNGAIFESSQGRFTSGPWENWEAYTRNSPVAQASKVKTPLIILHNDKDGAVDFNQGMEYYNALRRLQKPVVLLEYLGENHSLAKRANQKDYTVRMKEFFDHYLMDKPMPQWYAEGVPRLEMEQHLKSRQPSKPAEKQDEKRGQ
jgi:dipeptidyl aminopeptidase/acylaminoacyl peptidase